MLSAAWNFGIQRDLDTRNPLKKVKVEKLEKAETKILEPGQVAKLMVAAQGYEGGSMLAYFALCTFAGLRPTEAQRLTYDNINFEKEHIYVPSGKAKTRETGMGTSSPSSWRWRGRRSELGMSAWRHRDCHQLLISKIYEGK